MNRRALLAGLFAAPFAPAVAKAASPATAIIEAYPLLVATYNGMPIYEWDGLEQFNQVGNVEYGYYSDAVRLAR